MNELITPFINFVDRYTLETQSQEEIVEQARKFAEAYAKQEKNKLLDTLASKFPLSSINFKAFKE